MLVIARVIGGPPAIVNPHVAADGPARLLQSLQKSSDTRLRFLIVRSQVREYADPPHPLRRPRARRERPRCRGAAQQRDKLAPPHHSITSSARASNVGGISRPSALAVTKLMMRSNLVGCSTGSSAGFAPRRILST